MATKVYGASDDLIEVEGDVTGEVGCYGTDDEENKPHLFFSDGTVLRVFYGKDEKSIWAVELVERGSLFERIDLCTDEDANPYSDVAHFRDGLKWAHFAKETEVVK
jgi:hypothetical protein